jgi:hypothetical protein
MNAFAALGVWRDQHPDALVDDPLHLLVVPVAGLGQQHVRGLVDAGRRQLALGGGEHRSRCPKSGAAVMTWAAITIWCSLATACAL